MFAKTLMGLLLCCLSVTSGMVQSETFRVIAYLDANPPFNIINSTGEGEHRGIFADIFSRIGAITGDEFVFVQYPVSRALLEFELGRVDIEPGVNEAWRQNSKVMGLYSIEYAKATEVILFDQGKKVPVKQAADLAGKTLGVVRGYAYPRFSWAFSNGVINRVDNISELLLLKQLDAGRYDQIFISYRTALYYMKSEQRFRRFEVGDVVSQVSSKMRVHPSKAHFVERLNMALAQMVDSGEINRIYDKYR